MREVAIRVLCTGFAALAVGAATPGVPAFADDAGGYGEQQQVSSNNPAAYDGWWYFQSTWDPPDMNFTGLGG